MTINVNKPIVDLDFSSNKEALKLFLKSQKQFADYNFDGSNMSVLLDVLAYNSYQNNFYTNMAMSEMFLDTAQLKNSIVSHAKELNYLPKSNTSSKANVKVTIRDPLNTQSIIVIPEYTKFKASFNEESFTFVTDQTHIAARTAPGVYIADDINIYEGSIVDSFEKEGYILGSDETNFKCILSNDNIDISTIRVFVGENSQEYVYKGDIFGTKEQDFVFYVEPHFDNKYAVIFGKNIFGKQPEFDTEIKISYRVTNGAAANGAFKFSTTFLNNVAVYTNLASLGGTERESLENIRFFAPKSIQIQERAITSRDYEILLKQKYPEINSISVIGGDELDPPQYGKVAISVNIKNLKNISNYFKTEIIRYISDKSPLTIEPIFIDPEFLFCEIESTVYYNKNITSKTTNTLETTIRNSINEFAKDNINDFGSLLKNSRITSVIDSSDISIESSSVFFRPYIEYYPIINYDENSTFKFDLKLRKPYPFKETSGYDNYIPAIQSSEFLCNKTCCYMQDDGLGNIQLISTDPKNKKILKSSIGTVDYELGILKLIKFNTGGYGKNGIKIFANILNSDVKAPKNRVFSIKDEDVLIKISER